MMSILSKIIKMISKFNFNPGSVSRIEYIAIHYVGATGSAKQNCEYYAGGNRGASAHYFVDFNGDVYQSVEDQNIAWHCGADTYKHPECRNANSIGIELCCRTTGDPTIADANWYFEDATVESAIELTKELMAKYNIPADHVLRHYDITGKICPAPYVYNTGKHTWDQFQEAIRESSTSGSSSSNIQNGTNSQKDTDEIIWDAFRSAGFSEIATAAWLGNLKAESDLRANNLQNTYEKTFGVTDDEYTRAVDSGAYSKYAFYSDKAGYGLAQWTFWSRKKALYEYVIEKKKASIGDLQAQIEFLLRELTYDYVALVAKLKVCTTIKEASDLILTQFEQPADQSDSVKNTRASYAETFYKKFGGSVTNSGSSSTPQSGVPFLVDVAITDLNIRKGPGTNYAKTGSYTGKGRFTIVETQPGQGSNSGWGKLKSGAGWISLDYTKRV